MNTGRMYATLKKDWEMIDAATPDKKRTTVPPGRYELERVPNPVGYDAPWLVLKGTKIGMAEGAWRQWENGLLADVPGHANFGKPIDWGAFEIMIEQ